MIVPAVAWLILFLPLLAFLLLASVFRPAPKPGSIVSIAAVAASFGLSVMVFLNILGQAGHESAALVTELPFLAVGPYEFPFTIQIDAMTAMMLVVVTSVSLLVQVYSQGYMKDDPGFGRYYAYLSLFTTSMLGLVLASNLVLVFAFWELVGLSSFLLIGFWFDRPAAAAAAKKAFLTTRLGDFGFAIALITLFGAAGTLDIPELLHKVEHKEIAVGVLTIAALGLFAGAAGKSAQFPLHVWLPDAMEGPTPVSALIHAATMVAAGVYLVARTFPIFEAAPIAMQTVAWIGGITALFAATIGLTQYDIKRVMAYSTISQLGYMMLGLGVGGLVAGVFHLFTHAFFKALLFLGSGSVIHGTGTQDMREMGGLRKFMPVTSLTILLASLSLAGVPPFAGFFSKDEILADVFRSGNYALFAMGELTVLMTAFYITRLMIMTFAGEYRGPLPAITGASAGHGGHGGHDDSGSHGGGHGGHGNPHESPWVMTLPLLILAVPSVLAGLWSLNGGFHHFLASVPGVEHEAAEFNTLTAGISFSLAALGIAAAFVIYRGNKAPAGFPVSPFAAAFGGLYPFVRDKYRVDELYQWIIDHVVLGFSRALAWFDVTIVDGVVNGMGSLITLWGDGMRRWETGRIQNYGIYLVAGAMVVFLLTIAGIGSLVGR